MTDKERIEFAPKDRKSCSVRVSDHIFSGDVH